MNGSNSPVEAVSPAIEHVKRVLFRPFDLGRWFVLGFLSFLQLLGDGGNGFGPINFNARNMGGGEERSAQDMLRWVQENVPIVAIIGFFVVLVVLALIVLFLWLSSRATFCYLDSIVTNRVQVVEPWKRHREPADSYFFWRLVFSVIGLFIGLALLAPVVISLIKMIQSGEEITLWAVLFGTSLAVMIFPLILFGVIAAIIKVLLVDFVVPVQYMRRLRCSEAFGIVWRLVKANLGVFVVYLLLRFVFWLLIGFGVFAFGCVTCCIGFCLMAIPVIGQTLLQPVYLFIRSFPLFFLRGFGPEFDVFAPAAAGPGGAPPSFTPGGLPPLPTGTWPSPDTAPTMPSGTPPFPAAAPAAAPEEPATGEEPWPTPGAPGWESPHRRSPAMPGESEVGPLTDEPKDPSEGGGEGAPPEGSR